MTHHIHPECFRDSKIRTKVFGSTGGDESFLWLPAYLTLCEWSDQLTLSPELFANTSRLVLFTSLCGETETGARKKEWEALEAEEEPLYKQFITLLRPVSPLSLYVSLPLSLFSPSVPENTSSPQTPSSFSPPPPSVSQSLSNPGGESVSSVMAYGYLTSASPLIRLSSLNDATCGATNATEKSIKAFH